MVKIWMPRVSKKPYAPEQKYTVAALALLKHDFSIFTESHYYHVYKGPWIGAALMPNSKCPQSVHSAVTPGVNIGVKCGVERNWPPCLKTRLWVVQQDATSQVLKMPLTSMGLNLTVIIVFAKVETKNLT